MSRTELNTGTSSRAELQGLDATNVEATNQATLSPISPNEVSNHNNDAKSEGKDADEINEIDKMLERVEELEVQFERDGEEADVKVVKDVDTPTQ